MGAALGKEREGMKKLVCLMVLVIAVSTIALGGCKKKEAKPGAPPPPAEKK